MANNEKRVKKSACQRHCEGLSKKKEDLPEESSHFSDESTPVGASEASMPENSPYPVPYTFRIQAPIAGRAPATQTAKSPPFYLQLDHTIAVLWCLFRNKTKAKMTCCELGVNQLQWALFFLKGIKSPNGGDRAEDVTLAIQAVQDALLELYADMSEVVLRSPQDLIPKQYGSTKNSEQYCTVCEKQKAMQQVAAGSPGPPQSDNRKNVRQPIDWAQIPVPKAPCHKCSSVTLGSVRGEGRPRKSGPAKERDPYGDLLSEEFSFSQREECYAPRPAPAPCPHRSLSEQSKKSREIQNEIIELKGIAADLARRTPGTTTPQDESESSPDLSKDALYAMMQNWREEQVNRIEMEMRRLRSLDSAMGVKNDVTQVSFNQNTSGIQFQPAATSTPYRSK